MNRNLLTGLMLWLTSCIAVASPVTLKPGINYMDLNHDGIKDMVVMAQFDNNTSHPNLGLTFIVSCPNGGYCIMPVANSNLFTWFDYRLSADAEFLVQDNRLYKFRNRYFLMTATKKGENAFEPGKTELRTYRFTESRDDPGVPLYDWVLHKTQLTKNAYQSASEAWQEVDEEVFNEH
nr:CpmJ protein [Pantoea cypripedii]